MKKLYFNKLAGPLVGAAALGYELYRLGNRASKAIANDPPFPTTTTMPTTYRPKFTRRVTTRRRYVPRRYGMTWRTLTRTTASFNSFQIAAAATTGFKSDTILLDFVQTTDIVNAYDLYRIKHVDVFVTNRIDPANSGLANVNPPLVTLACDPASSTPPTTMTQAGAYDNAKSMFIVSGQTMRYRFYPKVTNSVDISGTATAAGSYATNPWLRLDAIGITVPHLSCLFAAQNNLAIAGNPQVFSYYYRITFQVKNIK